jgi:hypothetical protein
LTAWKKQIETWDIANVVQTREGVVSMEECVILYSAVIPHKCPHVIPSALHVLDLNCTNLGLSHYPMTMKNVKPTLMIQIGKVK